MEASDGKPTSPVNHPPPIPRRSRGFEFSPEFFLVLIVGVWGTFLWDATRRPDPRTGPLFLLASMFTGIFTGAVNIPKWRFLATWRKAALVLTLLICVFPFLKLGLFLGHNFLFEVRN